MLRLVVHFDGGGSSRGGPGAWGVVVAWEDGAVIEQFAGWHPDLTNNEAEYHGLLAALRAAAKYAPLERLTVRGDSQIVIRQVNGSYRCKQAHLKPLYTEACLLMRALGMPSLEWIPREENTAADALSTQALKAGGPIG